MPWSSFSECGVLSQLFHSPLSPSSRGSLVPLLFLLKGGIIWISEAIDISPWNLDSSLCFMQSSILHDVLCIAGKKAGWQYTASTYSFSNLEPVCCFMSSSICCFLTCIQFSQEAGQVVWYSLLFQNFPVCCDPTLWRSQWSRNRWFSGIPLLSLWSSECWPFDPWFLCFWAFLVTQLVENPPTM